MELPRTMSGVCPGYPDRFLLYFLRYYLYLSGLSGVSGGVRSCYRLGFPRTRGGGYPDNPDNPDRGYQVIEKMALFLSGVCPDTPDSVRGEKSNNTVVKMSKASVIG